MTFPREQPLAPIERGDYEIALFVPGPNNEEQPQSAKISVQIVMSDSSIRVRDFDLLLRLQDDATGQQHLQNLVALRNYLNSRIDAELIP
jgi:hypothetical protein